MCMFCRSLFVLLYFFFWSLCCLFFFDIQILITPLVYSNSSVIFKFKFVTLINNFTPLVSAISCRKYRRGNTNGQSIETVQIEHTTHMTKKKNKQKTTLHYTITCNMLTIGVKLNELFNWHIINIPECEIKGSRFCNPFMVDKFCTCSAVSYE